MQSALTWEKILPVLEKHFTIYALDLPGFGTSEQPNDPWDIVRYAYFVHYFAERLSLIKPGIIGHSFGARIATEYANRFSVDALILSGMADDADPSTFRTSNRFLAKIGRAIAPTALYRAHQVLLSPRKRTDIVPLSRAEARRILDIFLATHKKTNHSASLHACPVLFIYGKRDPITPWHIGSRLQTHFIGATFIAVPRAGHFVHIDAPERFLELALAFLQRRTEN